MMYKKFLIVLVLWILGHFPFNVNAQSAPTSANQPLRFVFMTDLHVQPGVEQEMKKALDKAATLHPNFIITGGDLIMDALEADKKTAENLFSLYQNLMSESRLPVYNTPGNHDVWGWGLKNVDTLDPDYGLGMFGKRWGNPYQLFSHQGIYFMLVPSMVYNQGSAYVGGFSEKTLQWAEENLKNIPKEAPIVLVSHIPLVTAETQWEEGALQPNHPMAVVGNSRDLLKLFEGRPLKLILQGHLHIWEKIEIAGVQIITGGAVSGKWWQGAYKGTPPGFVLVTITGNDIQAEYITY
ncbi:MAG: metallophosphoesterase family protein [Bacteroidales bacterium]